MSNNANNWRPSVRKKTAIEHKKSAANLKHLEENHPKSLKLQINRTRCLIATKTTQFGEKKNYF